MSDPDLQMFWTVLLEVSLSPSPARLLSAGSPPRSSHSALAPRPPPAPRPDSPDQPPSYTPAPRGRRRSSAADAGSVPHTACRGAAAHTHTHTHTHVTNTHRAEDSQWLRGHTQSAVQKLTASAKL